MMLFTFIKKDQNVIRIGAEASVPEELQVVAKPYSEAGYEPATAEEYDQQLIKGATSGMIPDPSMNTAMPMGEEKVPEVNT